jgi:NitT/TauT family transport system ATP-binding protein
VSTVFNKTPIVELKNVSKSFDDLHNGKPLVAVNNISLIVNAEDKGQFVVLLGPSGCGKSTILNLISGLLTADEGEVCVFGEVVTGPNPHSATVPQAYTCFPWLTTLANAEFGLAVQGESKAERRRIATEYLVKVGLGDRLYALPEELSGGMKQRVAIARTLAIKPSILLMDEPFGALDAQTRTGMQEMLLHLWAEEKNTIIFVTHDITEALLLADRIVVFSPSPARIIWDSPITFTRPRSAMLVREEEFMNLSGYLLGLLKTPQTGDVSIGER